MQMVAAAKLRRAQEAAVAARPYAQRMDRVLSNLGQRAKGQAGAPPLLAGTGKDEVHLLLVCTADRGLCGAFNTNIVRLAKDRIRKLLADGKTVKILCVGRKGQDQLRRDFGKNIIETVELRDVKRVGFANAKAIADKVLGYFNKGEFDVCTLFYSEFKSVIAQKPTAFALIPAMAAERSDADAKTAASEDLAALECEPSEEQILDSLLPLNIATQIFRALLENAASEQGARMSAMDSATRNAGDMINRLTINYNRSRQAMITKELIEIISGAEAL
jgi:F-type H+-transporting ATPase subunit gamma